MTDIEQQAEKMQTDLQIIVNACLKLAPKSTAIILYGGYGRGEGSWFQDAQGMWRPYNDYDVCIVINQKASDSEVGYLRRTLAEKIGITWVDISQISSSELKHLRPSILNYDFKNASKVIYGDSTVLDLIPHINVSTLPTKDIQVLYFTRLYAFIGSLNEKGFSQTLVGEASRFFRNQMAKAILAVVDVLLLAKGAYDASYCKRVNRVADLYPEKSELLKLSRWALEEKLRPQAKSMISTEVYDLYRLVHRYYLDEMYQGLQLYFGKSTKSPEDIEFCMKWLPKTMIRRFYWFAKFRNFSMERQLALMLAQNYLVASWKPEGINKMWLSRAIDLLRFADGGVYQKMSWDKTRLEAARLRIGG